MRRRIRLAIVGLGVLLAVGSVDAGKGPNDSNDRREPLLVFLVRHGEKETSREDPALTAAGRARAEALAHVLRSAEIEHVHSSDYARTRQTAAPTAAMLRRDIELYDAHELPALAAKLRRTGGRHLVVGHSNTTPQVVELLGGEPGPPIEEATEYDRLYVVGVARDGTVQSVLLRYGATPAPTAE